MQPGLCTRFETHTETLSACDDEVTEEEDSEFCYTVIFCFTIKRTVSGNFSDRPRGLTIVFRRFIKKCIRLGKYYLKILSARTENFPGSNFINGKYLPSRQTGYSYLLNKFPMLRMPGKILFVVRPPCI